MTKNQILKIFQAYVDNDYQATGDIGYVVSICLGLVDFTVVKDTLLSVADEYEIREMGFGWVLDNED